MWMMSGGMKGYGDLNDADLLSFLSANKVTVCNSWFRKRDIHKQTWQHSKKKKEKEEESFWRKLKVSGMRTVMWK